MENLSSGISLLIFVYTGITSVLNKKVMEMIISVGSTQHIDYLKSRIKKALRLFKNSGLKINVEERPAGEFTFLFCQVTYTKDNCSLADGQAFFRYFLADVIAELILNCWEKVLLWEIVRESYYYFSEDDKKVIVEHIMQYLSRREGCLEQGPINYLRRKNKVLQKLLGFLHNNNHLVIDGFIKFRLKDYLSELRDASDKAVDDFLIEREYEEFIQLLKHFVEVQEPRTDLVHVLLKAEGGFKLFDAQMKVIRSDYLEGFIIDLVDREASCEDLLISALITVAPKKIIAHLRYNDNAFETIKSVFTSRVDKCPGCSLCK
jgi:putative sporulation protein YtxC